MQSILADKLLWLVFALLGLALALSLTFRAPDPLLETLAVEGRPDPFATTDDPALHAVMNGTLPGLERARTVGAVFAAYRWFTAAPKWMTQGPALSRTVLVTAPLDMPAKDKALGMGSGSAMVFYTVEFGLAGDGKSFKPLSSSVDVRDGANKLVARVNDPNFLVLRRVMLGLEQGVSLKEGVRPGR